MSDTAKMTRESVLPREQCPAISLAVVVRNGARHLPGLVEDIAGQTLSRDRFEVIIVDGRSEDGTTDIVAKLLQMRHGITFKVVENPARILAAGWNIALAEANHPVIVRVDAHARIAPDFLERCLDGIESGKDIVGGPVLTQSEANRKSLLYHVETSRFAGGAADFRQVGPSRHVDTLAYAAYHKRTFERVGGFDERLIRNQDNEMHCRMKRAGFRFHYDPAIHSYHVMRTSWRRYLQQKRANGYWVALASAVRPGCFSLRHLLPGVFVGSLVAGLVLGTIYDFWWIFTIAMTAYTFVAILFSSIAVHRNELPRSRAIWMPFAFLLTHCAYGLGTLAGILAIPFFLALHRKYEHRFPTRDDSASSLT